MLNLFKENFKNISGLTLSKIYDKKAVMKYASKELNTNSNSNIEHRITNLDGTVTAVNLKNLNIKK